MISSAVMQKESRKQIFYQRGVTTKVERREETRKKECSFDFPGIASKASMVRSRQGEIFHRFTPGVADSAKKAMRKIIRN